MLRLAVKTNILFYVSKSDICVNYQHFEQIWMHFMVSQCIICIQAYFSRVKEKNKFSFGVEKRGEMIAVQWILRHGRGRFWTTVNVYSEPQ